MSIWSSEIKELEELYESFKGQMPELEKELEELLKTDNPVVILVYARRSLEIIVNELCKTELKRPRKTEPLKGIIDKLNSENKVPEHIVTSMLNLNSLSTYGAHPKEFDLRQVRTVLINLTTIMDWYLVYKGIEKKEIIDFNNKKSVIEAIETKIPKQKSIIVLPFQNMSPDPDQEYFSDGLTEEIITDLSHIHELLVISRSSAMTFKGTKNTISEIAKKVSVQYVLEGSVRKAGNNLKITAQLIEAATDTHIWAEKYNGTLDDIFEIQEKVSGSIVNALKLKLTSEEIQGINARPIGNTVVYELHIMARYEMWRATEEGLDRALNLVNKGLEIIGENEILYADAGQIYILYIDIGVKKEENLLAKADECIQKVFALNTKSSYGHYLKGMINRKKRDTQAAVREFKQSLDIDPNNTDSLGWISWVYSHSGKAATARPLIGKLLEIDMLNPTNFFWAGLLEVMDGKFNDGIKELNKGYQMRKDNPIFRYWIAKGLGYSQRHDEAFKLFDQIEEELPETVWASLGSFFKLALQKKKSEALGFLSVEFKMIMKEDEMFPIWIAESYSLINEKNEAIDWIEHGVNSGFINYPFLIEYDLFLANIRSEKRFKKLMERVKIEWENFET